MAEKINAYTSIADTQIAEFKDRGSRFIAYSYPFSALHLLKPILEQLKKEHIKAVHFCYAFRMGTNGLQYRANDDGEPAGSAGKPILGQIDSMELTDLLVVVVRYFGGTLLGVPGLINAYKTATKLVLQENKLITIEITNSYQVEINYNYYNDALVLLKKNNCTITHQDLQLFCIIEFKVALAVEESLLQQLNQMPLLQLHKIS